MTKAIANNGTAAVYACYASPQFNKVVCNALKHLTGDVRHALGDNLVALVLGGGYGRGEGGVVEIDGIEMPYNDLDLVLVVVKKSNVPMGSLRSIARAYERELCVHVDFARPMTIPDIRSWPQWMMWYDLMHGYQVLWGPENILADNAPKTVFQPLPVIEGTRLLLNRGAGLLGSMTVVRGVDSSQDADFARRNYYKCILAMGDALMVTYGLYQSRYEGRDNRFAELTETVREVRALDLVEIYRTALKFKFRPDKVDSVQPDDTSLRKAAEQWGAVMLQVERVRTGEKWSSLDEYTQWRGLREPHQHALRNMPRNFLRNLQVGRCSWRYPREWLYRRLPVLLGVAQENVPDWPTQSMRFLKIWERFS